MIARFVLAVFLVTLVSESHAAVVQDLEKNLTYARITDLEKDSAALEAALGKPDLILDLRNATASSNSAAVLQHRLAQAPNAPTEHRLILINPTTAPAIVEAANQVVPRQLTVGPKSSTIQTDIAVLTTPEDDRRAYQALGSGASLEKLIDSNPEKKRYDEAALAKNRNATGEDDAAEDETAPSPEKKPPVSEIHDLVLERAIQIHDALTAERAKP